VASDVSTSLSKILTVQVHFFRPIDVAAVIPFAKPISIRIVVQSMFLNECLGSFLVKNIVLVLFFLVTTIAGGLRADPLDLTCRKKGSGYLPYNERTHNWVGVGYVYDKAHCQ
jgi:hypothetical protein